MVEGRQERGRAGRRADERERLRDREVQRLCERERETDRDREVQRL